MTYEELQLLRPGDLVVAPVPEECYQEWEEGEIYELYTSDLPPLLEIRDSVGQHLWYMCQDDVSDFDVYVLHIETALLLT